MTVIPKQCSSCGGACGGTKKTGCLYRAGPTTEERLRAKLKTEREHAESLADSRDGWLEEAHKWKERALRAEAACAKKDQAIKNALKVAHAEMADKARHHLWKAKRWDKGHRCQYRVGLEACYESYQDKADAGGVAREALEEPKEEWRLPIDDAMYSPNPPSPADGDDAGA